MAMDFRRDLGKPFQPPYQASVSKYTDNYIILMSASKIFSYAGQRIAVMAISDALYKRPYEVLKERYGLAKFGPVMLQRILYCLSSGTAHTPQYALAAMLKAANDGELDFVEEVKEYGRRTEKMKEIFERNGFHIVYDRDLDQPLSDGFFFTVGYKDVEGENCFACCFTTVSAPSCFRRPEVSSRDCASAPLPSGRTTTRCSTSGCACSTRITESRGRNPAGCLLSGGRAFFGRCASCRKDERKSIC